MQARSTWTSAFVTICAAVSLVQLAACSNPEPAPADAPPSMNTTAAPAMPDAENIETASGDRFADYKGDATAGGSVFAQCKACHSLSQGVNGIGPSLYKMVGRRASQDVAFAYSPANRTSGITWTQEKLFQYLENPRRIVPGTKMSFAGMADPQQRADLIAYLAEH